MPRLFAFAVAGWIAMALPSAQTPDHPRPQDTSAIQPRALLDTYCISCHNPRVRTGGLALDSADATKPAANAEVWERVIAKLRAGSMPGVFSAGVVRRDELKQGHGRT
jgi:mono/diheme cytochrome c family protein